MIADNSDVNRLVLKDILSIGSHQVLKEASDGVESVTFYQEQKLDVFLLDLEMPKKDGLTVVKEIIQIDPNAKIILITASGDHKITDQCLDSGAISYVAKPFNFTDLLEKITEILEK